MAKRRNSGGGSGSGNRDRDTSQIQGAIDKLRLSNEDQLGEVVEQSRAIAFNTKIAAEVLDDIMFDMDLDRQRDLDRQEGGATPSPSGGTGDPANQPQGELEKAEKFTSKFSKIGKTIGTTFKGIGAGIGFAAAGIGAAAVGVSFIVKETRLLMTSFDEMAEGLEKLNQLELDPKVFDSIGHAIGSLVSELSIGNAIGLRILTGTAFDDLGDGLEKLNNLKFKPEGIENLGKTLAALGDNTGIIDSKGIQMLGEVNFTAIADGVQKLNDMADTVSPEKFGKIGEAIDELLSPLSAADAGEAGVLALVADNISPEFANSIKLLGQLDIPDDFEDNMTAVGEGLNGLISPFSLFDADNLLVLGSLKKSLPAVAEGVNGFTTDGETFKTNATLVGEGLQNLLDGTDDLFGATGLQAIDDNIIPLAQGVEKFTDIVDDAMAAQWKSSSAIVGQGFQDLLDGTDDLFGATGLQMVDDNIIPLAEGVKKFTDIVDNDMADSFKKSSKIIGDGFQDLLDGTDDLFGATGLQAIDDNLLPFAEGVAAIDKAGRDLELKNFTQIGLAIDEVQKLSDTLKDVDFEPLNEVELPIRNLHAFTVDLQTLMKGVADGKERTFKSLGLLGLNDELDFGDGLLNVDLKVDDVLSKVRKIKEALSQVVTIEQAPTTPPLAEDGALVSTGVMRDDPKIVGGDQAADAESLLGIPKDLFGSNALMESQAQNEELKSQFNGQGPLVVAPQTQVVNNNASTGVVMGGGGPPPRDYLDDTWSDY